MGIDKMTQFADPLTLFHFIETELNELGAKRFMEGPDERAQRAREAFAEYFFILAQKKLTGTEWWLSQPKDVFPDFDLISFPENPANIRFFRFELVTIPGRCLDANEMMHIVNKKITKGYPKKFNLLIFLNHSKSSEWVRALHERLETYAPFDSVWSVYLKFKDKNNLLSCVVDRIRPYPFHNVEANFDETYLHRPNQLAPYMEIIELEGKKFVSFKADFIRDFRKRFKKI